MDWNKQEKLKALRLSIAAAQTERYNAQGAHKDKARKILEQLRARKDALHEIDPETGVDMPFDESPSKE